MSASGECPARVIVEAPARLHLGFIDLHGGCGRRFGSIGVAVERPRYVVEARRATGSAVEGEMAGGEVSRIVDGLRGEVPCPSAVAVRVLEGIPRHQGLGSGTQRALAIGSAVSRLAGRTLSGAELARRLGRGRRSGVGVATFERGGLVVDGGIAHGQGHGQPRESDPDDLPPVIFQHALPEDWEFVLAAPAGEEGLHGPREEAVFRSLAPTSEATAGRISRLVLMKALPAALTDDIAAFGEAITEIQALMGKQFAPYQGGAYATDRGRAIAEFALEQGAAGAGQSSWGPTVFALVRGAASSAALTAAIRAAFGDAPLEVWPTRASPRGARVWAEPS